MDALTLIQTELAKNLCKEVNAQIMKHYSTESKRAELKAGEKLHVFESGAIRTNAADNVGFDQICPTALELISRIYKEGEQKQSEAMKKAR